MVSSSKLTRLLGTTEEHLLLGGGMVVDRVRYDDRAPQLPMPSISTPTSAFLGTANSRHDTDHASTTFAPFAHDVATAAVKEDRPESDAQLPSGLPSFADSQEPHHRQRTDAPDSWPIDRPLVRFTSPELRKACTSSHNQMHALRRWNERTLGSDEEYAWHPNVVEISSDWLLGLHQSSRHTLVQSSRDGCSTDHAGAGQKAAYNQVYAASEHCAREIAAPETFKHAHSRSPFHKDASANSVNPLATSPYPASSKAPHGNISPNASRQFFRSDTSLSSKHTVSSKRQSSTVSVASAVTASNPVISKSYPAAFHQITNDCLLEEKVAKLEAATRRNLVRKRDWVMRSIVLRSNACQSQGHQSAKLANLTGTQTTGQTEFDFDNVRSTDAFATLHCFKVTSGSAKEEQRLCLASDSYVALAESASAIGGAENGWALKVAGLSLSSSRPKSRAAERQYTEWLLLFDSKHRMLYWLVTVKALISALDQADQVFRTGVHRDKSDTSPEISSPITPKTPEWSPHPKQTSFVGFTSLPTAYAESELSEPESESASFICRLKDAASPPKRRSTTDSLSSLCTESCNGTLEPEFSTEPSFIGDTAHPLLAVGAEQHVTSIPFEAMEELQPYAQSSAKDSGSVCDNHKALRPKTKGRRTGVRPSSSRALPPSSLLRSHRDNQDGWRTPPQVPLRDHVGAGATPNGHFDGCPVPNEAVVDLTASKVRYEQIRAEVAYAIANPTSQPSYNRVPPPLEGTNRTGGRPTDCVLNSAQISDADSPWACIDAAYNVSPLTRLPSLGSTISFDIDAEAGQNEHQPADDGIQVKTPMMERCEATGQRDGQVEFVMRPDSPTDPAYDADLRQMRKWPTTGEVTSSTPHLLADMGKAHDVRQDRIVELQKSKAKQLACAVISGALSSAVEKKMGEAKSLEMRNTLRQMRRTPTELEGCQKEELPVTLATLLAPYSIASDQSHNCRPDERTMTEGVVGMAI